MDIKKYVKFRNIYMCSPIPHRISVRVYIDGANPSFIKSLKRRIVEDEHYEKHTKEQLDKYARNMYSMKVYPINFASKHKDMLGHAKLPLERGYIAN
jgi:hypothetical protein